MLIHHKGKKMKKANKLKIDNKEEIYAYLQGMVILWCKLHKDKPFCIRKLVGESNGNWQDTPLQQIYETYYQKYKNKYAEHARKKAYIASKKTIGHALKTVLQDKIKNKTFILMPKSENTNYYRWKIKE